MAEQDIDDVIATTDGDTTWGDDLRGAMTTLKLRSGSIAAPSGAYIDQRGIYRHSAAAGSYVGIANLWQMAPFCPDRNVEISAIGSYITTGVGGAQVKLVIYSATAAGWPDTLLHETAAIAAATSSTFVSASHSRTFTAGTVYWLGIRHSSTSTVQCVPNAYAPMLTTTTPTNVGTACSLERSLTFATAATSPYAFVASSDLSNTDMPLIRMLVV